MNSVLPRAQFHAPLAGLWDNMSAMKNEHLPEIDVTTIPQLADLVEQVLRTRTARRLVLKPHGMTVGYLDPPAPEFDPAPIDVPAMTTTIISSRQRSKSRGSYLLGLAAIADSITGRPEGPTDVARNKHKYLGEAYARKPHHQPER